MLCVVHARVVFCVRCVRAQCVASACAGLREQGREEYDI